MSQGNHAEAGAAYTKAACMIAGQLEQANLVPDGTRDSLLHVIPWYAPKGVKQDHQGKEAIESDRRAMIAHVEQAASAYKDGGCFETAVKAYQVLTHVYGTSLEYPKLALLHGNIRSMYQLAIAAESSEARMLGTYFRVGFYGSEFGAENGQQYIYKHPKITQIVEVKEAMVATWTRRLADVVVSVISTSHPVDKGSLDGPHLQITKVDPDVDGEDRQTHFHKNTNIQSFSFESPFTLNGKGQAAIDVQWVRRTVLSVATPFPCTRLRQVVVSSDSTEAAPIANAIDIVKRRCKQLRKVANLDSGLFSGSVQLGDVGPNRNMLEQQLCGSLLLQVNGGALEVASSFLRRERPDPRRPNPWPEPEAPGGGSPLDGGDAGMDQSVQHTVAVTPAEEEEEKEELPEADDLRDALGEFLTCCKDALVVYTAFPSSQELLVELQKGLRKLTSQLGEHGAFPPVPLAAASGSGDGPSHRRSMSWEVSHSYIVYTCRRLIDLVPILYIHAGG